MNLTAAGAVSRAGSPASRPPSEPVRRPAARSTPPARCPWRSIVLAHGTPAASRPLKRQGGLQARIVQRVRRDDAVTAWHRTPAAVPDLEGPLRQRDPHRDRLARVRLDVLEAGQPALGTV